MTALDDQGLDKVPDDMEVFEEANNFPFQIGDEVQRKDMLQHFVSIGWLAPLHLDTPRRRRKGIGGEFKDARDLVNTAARMLDAEKRFHIFYYRPKDCYEILSALDSVKKDPAMVRVRGLSKHRQREFGKNLQAADGQLGMRGEGMGKWIAANKEIHSMVQMVTLSGIRLQQIFTGAKPAEQTPPTTPKKIAARETRTRRRPKKHSDAHAH